MTSSPEPHVSNPTAHWLGITEVIAVVGSVGSAIAAISSQQFVALASLPLSISLALSLANRGRLIQEMDRSYQAQIAQILSDRQSDQQVLSTLVTRTEAFSMHIVDITHDLAHNQNRASTNEQLLKDLRARVDSTQVIQAEMGQMLTHLQKATAQPDEFYFEEGMVHQNAGDLEAAVNSLNLAIKANETMAEAYYQRGLVKAELGQRQAAISDLRTAASHFFDQGKLEQYQRAKDLSKKVHEALNSVQNPPQNATVATPATSENHTTADSVSVSNLFN